MKTNKIPTTAELCEWLNSTSEVKLFKVIDGVLHCKVNLEFDKYFKVVNSDNYLYLAQFTNENN